MKFEEFVKENLKDFDNKLKPIYSEWNQGRTDDCLSYYFAHKPRFDAMIDIVYKNNVPKGDIAELGSFLPYTSFHLDSSAVDCYDILFKSYNIDNFGVGKFTFNAFNLNYDKLPRQYDLVIMSEVIEHLPSNLFELEKRTIDGVKKGGYLLVTYPMIGTNACDYDKDYGEHDRFRHEHLREFNNDTVPLFFKTMQIVDSTEITYPAYGRIKLVLYKKVSN